MRGFDLIVEHGFGFQVSGLRRSAALVAACFPLLLQGIKERAHGLGSHLAGFAVDVVPAALTGSRAAFILARHALFTGPRGTTLAASSPSMRETMPESQASSFSAASRR